jgi:hypothetical protein
VDSANAAVPEMPAAARLFPGAPVVSIRTYVLFSTCAMGVPVLEGDMDGVTVGEGDWPSTR